MKTPEMIIGFFLGIIFCIAMIGLASCDPDQIFRDEYEDEEEE